MGRGYISKWLKGLLPLAICLGISNAQYGKFENMPSKEEKIVFPSINKTEYEFIPPVFLYMKITKVWQWSLKSIRLYKKMLKLKLKTTDFFCALIFNINAKPSYYFCNRDVQLIDKKQWGIGIFFLHDTNGRALQANRAGPNWPNPSSPFLLMSTGNTKALPFLQCKKKMRMPHWNAKEHRFEGVWIW